MEHSATILYVEDNPENRMLVQRVLEADGFEVLEAPSAAQTLELIKTRRPDLILMDINMPEVDGYTLTNHLKALPALYGIPIIAMTANVMRGDRERTLEAGCDGYIQKPIDVDRLPIQIRQYLTPK